MRKSVSLLLVATLCVVMFGLPSAARADEMKVAKRWALGLGGNAADGGLAPTVEYWTSENFGLSASFSYFFWASMVGVRGTYLWDTPIHIFSMPARPYAGAGLGLFTVNPYLRYGTYYGPSLEVFGGLLQPLSDRWSVRAELAASFHHVSVPGEYVYSNSYSPITLDVGIFYHSPR